MVRTQSTSKASEARRPRGRPRGDSTPLSAEEIIDAAVEAVRRHGPLLSMDDIASQAGVTKPIIYRTVGQKAAVARALSDRLVAEVERVTVGQGLEHPRSFDGFRSATRSFFETLHRDRNLLMFVDHGWGATDGSLIDELIKQAALPYVEGFSQSPATVGQPEWRRETWALATVGVLRTVARIWTLEPYCTLDEVVDDVVSYVLNAHKSRSPESLTETGSPDATDS